MAAVRGREWVGGRTKLYGNREARGLGEGAKGEGRLDRDRFHLIFEIHLGVPTA